MSNILEEIPVCECGKILVTIVNDNKAEHKCFSCGSIKNIKDTEIYKEILKDVSNTSITYSGIINKIADDNTSNKIKLDCEYCSYPIMHIGHIGDDMRTYIVCPSCKKIKSK